MASTDDYIGNYRVISQLSSDPFSNVYSAEPTFAADRLVAIRVWHAVHLNSAEDHTAFLQEAQTLVELRHPYILSSIQVGVAGDSPYVVTDYPYIPAGSLRDRIHRQAPLLLPLQEANTILSQLGSALHYAHERNTLHRQLKPGHIVFTMKGEVQLTDFGLPTILAATTGKDSEHVNADPYTAPEQLQGIVSKESDQYALGCIVYELFTGQQPAHPLVPPTQLNPSLPLSIEQAILKAMAPEPVERYPDVMSFIAALYPAPSSEVPTVATTLDAETTLKLFPEGTSSDGANGAGLGKSASLGIVSTPKTQWKLSGKAKIFSLVALILLITGSSPFLVPRLLSILPASAAIVTITPASQHMTGTYSIEAVTGTPAASQAQARLLSFTTMKEAKTVQATGQGSEGVTEATGTLIFSNSSNYFTIFAQTFAGNSGVGLVIDNAFNIAPGQTVAIFAHAARAGSIGNVPADDIDGTSNVGPGLGTIHVENTSAFTGGTDQSFAVVQQSDIDTATTSLQDQLTATAQMGLQQLLHAGEQLVIDSSSGTNNGIRCTPKITADHQANDRATNVTVTGTVTCHAEAYVPQDLQSLASMLFQTDIASQLGPDYRLVGNLVSGMPVLMMTDSSGVATFTVDAQGVWVYQFNDTQKQQLARSIAGKTQADARVLLLKQQGITKVSFKTSGLGNALPSAANNIGFIVVDVPGL